MKWLRIVSGLLCLAWTSTLCLAAPPEKSLPEFWVDDDLNEGFARARMTNKPLLLVFRCVP